jgi:hypothetical protein
MDKLKTTKIPFVAICYLILVPLIAHLLFSPLGFNPTDDGFTLAYSRRILDGQIPHRDFILIRPILSPLLHTPFVLWGGDYTYLLSRLFVWFQMAFISWTWVLIVEKWFSRRPFQNLEKVALALISFAVSASTFPIMAWHTIDGLFFITIGLFFCLNRNSPNKKLIGYLILSLSYLCKQSFILIPPITMLIMGDWRKIKYWVSVLFPGILYASFLLITGAFSAAFLQLTSLSDFFFVGFLAYLNWKLLLGIFIGNYSAFLLNREKNGPSSMISTIMEWVGAFCISILPLIGVYAELFTSSDKPTVSFGIFGLVIGVLGYHLIARKGMEDRPVRLALLGLAIAWDASLSIGYNSAILTAGQMTVLLLACTFPFFKKKLENIGTRPLYPVLLLCLTAIVLLLFGITRFRSIYREQSSQNLTRDLAEVLPGGSGIRTNENTYRFLRDLHEAINASLSQGVTYTIIPDCAGWWVKSQQANPLLIDWPHRIELNSPVLVSQVEKELESMRQTNIVIVQKVEADTLAEGFTPLGNGNAIVNYVHKNFTKIDETSLFELYK